MAVPSYFSAINSESLPQREIFSLDLFSVGPHSNYISAAFFFFNDLYHYCNLFAYVFAMGSFSTP